MKTVDLIPATASKSNDSIITVLQVCRKITKNANEDFSFGNGDGKHLVESPSLINLVKLAGKRTDQGTEYILVPITSWGKNSIVAENMNSLGERMDLSISDSESTSDSEHDMTQNSVQGDLNKSYNNFPPSDNSHHNNLLKSCFPFIFKKKNHAKK